MAKKINHLVRHRFWFRDGVQTWCGQVVAKAAPFWFATTCSTCRTVRRNTRAARKAAKTT